MLLSVSQNARYQAILFGLLGSLCHCLSFPTYSLFFTAFFIFFFFLFAIEKIQSWKDALWVAASCNLFTGIISFGWIKFVVEEFGQFPIFVSIPMQIVFSFLCEPHFYLFFLFAFYCKSYWQKWQTSFQALAYPTLYVALEFIIRDFKLFPDVFGNSQWQWLSLAQLASWGGMAAISMLLVFFGSSLYFLIRKPKNPQAQTTFLFAIACIAIAHFWGTNRINWITKEQAKLSAAENFQIAMLQANISNVDKLIAESGNRKGLQSVIDRHMGLAESAKGLDLVIWPETAFPLYFPTSDQYRSSNWSKQNAAKIAEQALFNNHAVLLGGYEYDFKKAYNAAILLNHLGETKASYKKHHLLAFGEYMPFGEIFPSLKKLNPMMGDFGRGRGPYPLELIRKDGSKIFLGINICYEALIFSYMRELARNGSSLYINLTNDAWFGDSHEPWQHLLLALFRSIENGVPFVRATNTGVSAAYDVAGQEISRGPLFEKAVIRADVPLLNLATFYRHYGEFFAYFIVGLSLLLCFPVVKNLWENRK